jgi:hypothetical protein
VVSGGRAASEVLAALKKGSVAAARRTEVERSSGLLSRVVAVVSAAAIRTPARD